jgi:hypothetical protein
LWWEHQQEACPNGTERIAPDKCDNFSGLLSHFCE